MEREYKRMRVYGEWNSYVDVPIITKEELMKFPPRFLLSQKPYNFNSHHVDDYIEVRMPYGQYVDNKGWGCIKCKDFQEVLNSMPHIPNKKESKALRKAKIKQGR